MGRTKILEFNFIKAISAIGIVAFHFYTESGNLNLLPGNYSWGGIFVTIFFLVSGALLYYNYNEPKNLKLFYFKRWKSIMPDFYVAFLCLYGVQVIKNGNFFYNGRPETLLLTIIGQDGYFLEIIPNYYLLGEWFLGAIIILYLLYPFLAKLMNKNEILLLAIITLLYFISLLSEKAYINDFRSIFSCVFSFTFGIAIEKHKVYKYRWLSIPALICFILENFLITKNEINFSAHVGGVLLFFILFAFGGLVYHITILGRISDFLSNISYDIFLIHHVTLIQILKIVPPFHNFLLSLIYLVISIIVIVGVATVFSKIMKLIINSKNIFYKVKMQLVQKNKEF